MKQHVHQMTRLQHKLWTNLQCVSFYFHIVVRISTKSLQSFGLMETSSPPENGHHAITIWEVNPDRLASMHKKLSEPPKLLRSLAGRNSCIFRVPQSFVDINGKSYQPQIVSIGPYHHAELKLRMIEEHKWRYLASLLNRINTPLQHFFKAIEPLETHARDCYAEKIDFDKDQFLEVLVVDGLFLIELFRKVANPVKFEPDDPIYTMNWILPFFYRDFLRIENQIPYFVLQRIYELCKEEEKGQPEPELEPTLSLTSLALKFFSHVIERLDEKIENLEGGHFRHLLDLVRTSLIPPQPVQNPKTTTTNIFNFNFRGKKKPRINVIPSISKLRRAGIKLNTSKEESFLHVRFRHGVIEMPTITIDDFMTSFLLNCVAYEQCQSGCESHMTSYATLLDYLINTTRDVEYLCDRYIIENNLGTDMDIARFINNMGKDVAFDVELCYLKDVFDDVHEYYENSWHVYWASFKHTYFETPWSFISALAALILLLLTVAQTFYTIYPQVTSRRN